MPLPARLIAGLGLVVAGLVHGWVWSHGYRHTTVGPVLLVDALLSAGVGAVVLGGGRRLAAWAGAVAAGAALMSYGMARTVGLLGFVERSWTAASLVAAGCEGIVVVVLLTEVLMPDGQNVVVIDDPQASRSDELTVWFNPGCSKCVSTRALLDGRGWAAHYVEYLKDSPARAELERVLSLLGSNDPRVMARTDEALWAELGLDRATPAEILDALADNPILIQRPIVIRGDRAVIGRPPERVLDLLTNPDHPD